ncbi:MAG TPA: protoporphyrinogen oxidase [Gemmatimonadales bacterium]|jgi:oxygen-dependent protoporphyrinogen oxidase|nr:protoporphyrinogen oxidase [Gemmatimonadales bacterium]
MKVAVVGGGLTGLAAAYRLQTLGFEPTVYESAARVGGVVWTEREAGFLAETGPNSLSNPNPMVGRLLGELGLSDRLIEANPAARCRYIVRDGRLEPLPSSPLQLLTTPLLSPTAKLRLLKEPFVAKADPAVEESVGDFVRRRLGDEVLAYVVGPFVGGVYAGNPDALSMRHALPKLYAMEQEHGSMLAAMLARARASRRSGSPGSSGSVFSFPHGLGELTEVLVQRLAGRVCTASPVRRLSRRAFQWIVATDQGDARFAGVIFAAPAHAFGDIEFACDESEKLREAASIAYAPVAVVVLGFPRGAVAHPLDGFGVLVPAAERRRMLGTLFSSTLFPGRAPEGSVTLTTFVGGMGRPDLVGLEPDALVGLVRDELTDLLGVFGDPAFQRVSVWPKAIPQYDVGHQRWLDLLDEIEGANSGLALVGTYRFGVSLGDALASGLAAGDRLGLYLGGAGPSLR